MLTHYPHHQFITWSSYLPGGAVAVTSNYLRAMVDADDTGNNEKTAKGMHRRIPTAQLVRT